MLSLANLNQSDNLSSKVRVAIGNILETVKDNPQWFSNGPKIGFHVSYGSGRFNFIVLLTARNTPTHYAWDSNVYFDGVFSFNQL